jgi:hypothetical protein
MPFSMTISPHAFIIDVDYRFPLAFSHFHIGERFELADVSVYFGIIFACFVTLVPRWWTRGPRRDLVTPGVSKTRRMCERGKAPSSRGGASANCAMSRKKVFYPQKIQINE